MIGKAKSIAHTANAVDYAVKKNGAEIIDKRMVVGESGVEIAAEFRVFQDLNHSTKNKSISMVLSPEPEDGRKLGNTEFRNIANEFLSGMGLEEHQAIVVKHTDRNHAHLHIICNRIDSSGGTYKDKFIGKKAQRIADVVAGSLGLIRARVVRDLKKKSSLQLRNEIYRLHKEAMNSMPMDFTQYVDVMISKGVDIEPAVNKKGKLQGFRVRYQGQSFKASEVDRNMSFSKLTFTHNTKIGSTPTIRKMQGRKNGLSL
ncbi:relaxase/mobilization nuclease domain-containing protein [Prolixibacter sp. NT017]|uniref:relaxase/mobilization nuclease domain-containing protein n=1 Tax=Prolixibacter sp. NT017 TaxID=2652390 RepID=UPI00126B10D0|nr:relaxase/mobilization nuclease domain-containing protein [Prolixibacter sp. NT017]GET25843.1 hypothetical protein NT017_21720 [Prolixibacter sp. NT017]